MITPEELRPKGFITVWYKSSNLWLCEIFAVLYNLAEGDIIETEQECMDILIAHAIYQIRELKQKS